jgi:hypothetical protein
VGLLTHLSGIDNVEVISRTLRDYERAEDLVVRGRMGAAGTSARLARARGYGDGIEAARVRDQVPPRSGTGPFDDDADLHRLFDAP